jgi:hypothetical protein
MGVRQPEIVTLIRLRQGSLSHADGLRLREELATDGSVRTKWRLLCERLDSDSSLVLPVNVSEETVAAFVDGRLDEDAAANIEARCWSEPALLRETAAACEAQYAIGDAESVPPNVTARLQTVVAEALGLTDSAVENSARRNGSASTVTVGRTNDRSLALTLPAEPKESVAIITTSPQPQPRRGRMWWVVASLTAMVVVGVALLLIQRSGTNRKGQMVVQPAHPPGPTDESQDDPLSGEPRLAEDRDQVENLTPSSIADVAPTPGATTDSLDPVAPLVATEAAASHSPPSDRPVAIEWTRVSGLLLRRDPSTGRWQGIHAEAVAGAEEQGPARLMTLPDSWAEGETVEGNRIVLDADAEVRLELRRDEHLQLTIECERGQAAFEQLEKGDTVVVRIKEGGWSAESVEEGTSLGLVPGDAGLKLHVFSGGAQIGRTRIREGFAVDLSTGPLVPERAVRFSEAWRFRPAEPFPLKRDVVEQLLAGDDVLAQLDAWNDRRTESLTTRMALAIDPVTRVPRMAMSASESDRVASIQWLVHASEHDSRVEAVWAELRQGPLRQANVSPRPWLQMVRDPQSVGVAELRQMITGLGPGQPIFLRQAAIYALRQITGRPLREYSIEQPSRAGISAVSQQVRQFQNRRRLP